LSEEQKKVGEQRIERLGLSDRIVVLLCDMDVEVRRRDV